MKKFLRHSTPHFRCYHGSRLPPKSFENMWKSSKFYSKDIKWGAPKKEKKATRALKQKAKKVLPAKRQKRGALKKSKTAKTKVQVKTLKPRKRVSWSKVKAIGKRHEQKEQLYDPYQVDRFLPANRRVPSRTAQVGSRGDQQGTRFRLTKAGELVPVKRRKGRIAVV